MPVVTRTFTTSGMHCRSCSMLVDMTVAELDGVESSESDSAAGSTVVAFDTDKVDAETIVGAIRSVGYEAQISE